jgi:serine/threonine protein kinase
MFAERKNLQNLKQVSKQIKKKEFFMACIISSFEHIHNKNILHRDLKPENLVLDDKGRRKIKNKAMLDSLILE